MVKFVRENSLSIVFGVLLLAALVGQLFAGLAEYNNQQVAAGLDTVSLGEYATSADFAADVAENWQSEYLQFFLYVTATVWLLQRGSPESKKPVRWIPIRKTLAGIVSVPAFVGKSSLRRIGKRL